MKQVFAGILLVLFSGSLLGAQSKSNLVKAELVADVSAIKPGETFKVGVLLTIAPGWHVYWMNPGDSGRATTVKFRTPEGFIVSPLKYPVPIQFKQPGDITGYGYEKEVFLITEVKAPATLKAGSRVEIPIDVVWLSCKESCIPGKAKLNLSLSVADQTTRANEAAFKQWADRFPVDKDPAIKSAELETDEASGVFTHKIEWAIAAPKRVELYPGKDDAVETSDIQVKSETNRTQAKLSARLWPGQKKAEAETLPTLLVYTDANGDRHGVNLPIPLKGLRETPAKID